jgi:hypothetical protein
MSLHVLANHMAATGRGPDSTLVHMSPREVHGLQALAMANGGTLTINPQTGLPEAGFLDSLLPALAGFALNTFAPGLGQAVGGMFGLGGAAGTAIAVGGATALASGDLSKGLMAGMGAYGGAGIGGSLASAGAPSAGMDAASAARDAGISAAAETNPAATAARLQAGANTAMSAPTDFMKSNMMNLGFAAAPAISGVYDDQPTSGAPKIHPGYIRQFKTDPVTGRSYQTEAVKADEWGSRPGIEWGGVPKPQGYADGGTTTDEIKKGVPVWGGVSAPDLTGRDLNDRRSDSEKAQRYLMGEGPNPFLFYSKAPVVNPIEKAAEATKEIAKVVEQQQEQRSGGNSRGADDFGGIASLGGSTQTGYNPDVNSYTNGILPALLGQQAVPAPIVDTTGYSSVAEAASAQNQAMANQYAQYRTLQQAQAEQAQQAAAQAEQAQQAAAVSTPVTYSPITTSDLPSNDNYSNEGRNSGGGYGGGDGGAATGGRDGDASGGGDRGTRGGFADGGTTGSGSLDLHVPINLGGEGGEGGGGGSGGGGFGGGQYQPVGQGGGMGGGLGGLLNQGSNGRGDFGPQMQGGMSQPSPNFLQQQMNSLPGFQSMQKAQQDFTNSADYKNFQNYAQEYQQQFQPQQQPSAFGGTMGGSRYGLGLQGGGTNQFGGSTAFNGGDSRMYEQTQMPAGYNAAQGDMNYGMGNGYSSMIENTNQAINPNADMKYSAFAAGGITALADGGMYNLGSYSDGGRLLRGPGDGVSDDIPATIGEKQPADGEFVVPARIVSELGNGSTEAGARKLYAMMDRVQKARTKTVGKNKVAANSRAEKYLPA